MKLIIFLLTFLIFVTNVNAYNTCEDGPEVTTTCAMITPTITQCTNYSYAIYDVNATLIKTDVLSPFTQDSYYFNFTQPEGKYVIRLCDGAIKEVAVKHNPNNEYYLYIVALVVMFVLIGLGHYLEDLSITMIGGMLGIIIGIYIHIAGFPNLTSTFLKDGISVVFMGIGFFFSVVPAVDYLEGLF